MIYLGDGIGVGIGVDLGILGGVVVVVFLDIFLFFILRKMFMLSLILKSYIMKIFYYNK